VLREAYWDKKPNELKTWFKSFFGLSYLPPADVGDSFTDLLRVAPTGAIYFTDYILDTYIDGRTTRRKVSTQVL